jgi:hypothetical protein
MQKKKHCRRIAFFTICTVLRWTACFVFRHYSSYGFICTPLHSVVGTLDFSLFMLVHYLALKCAKFVAPSVKIGSQAWQSCSLDCVWFWYQRELYAENLWTQFTCFVDHKDQTQTDFHQPAQIGQGFSLFGCLYTGLCCAPSTKSGFILEMVGWLTL